MNGRLFLALVVAAVCAAVVAGLALVGGPMQARRDRLDEKRLADIRALADLLVCKRGDTAADSPLPMELSVESLLERCSAGRFVLGRLPGAETVKGYSYERINDHAFRICATFHDAERAARFNPAYLLGEDGARFDPATGCISGRTN